MKSALKLLVGVAALSLLVNCGSDDDDDDGSGGSSGNGSAVSIDEVPALYAAAACQAYERCAGAVLDLLTPGEDCADKIAAELEEELPRFEEAVDRGTLVYDGTKLRACTDELQAKSCDELLERESETCEAALEGMVAVGEDCTLSAECEGSAYCKFGDACPGTCAELELAGQACEEDSQCASGLVCSGETSRCVVPAAIGEACLDGEPDCALGGFCSGATDDAPRTCVSYDEAFAGAEGDDCALLELELCESGLVCGVESASLAGAVTKCMPKVASGDDCVIAFPDQCPVDEYCAVPEAAFEGVCEPRPEAGEPCAANGINDETDICAPNTRCDGGTCRDFAALGEGCETDEVCVSGHCLDGACVSASSCE
jgi:hypothetical protein